MLLAILPVLACGCHGSYLISQAAGEVRLLAAARPVEEVRSDPSQPSGRIENLRELAGLLAFAGDVGLDVGDSYRTVADHEGPVTWVVVAVKPGEIELFRWHFPLVGSVPYKGWFREEGAEMEAQEMRRRGFDVAVLPVPAFSTLGWFSDPLMPIQLDAPAGEFAEVVDLVASGAVRPPVDHVYDFSDLPAALARMDAGDQIGKLALRVR